MIYLALLIHKAMRYSFCLVFLLGVFTLAGCDKDQVLIKDIAGNWQVSRITYRLPSGDSTVNGTAIAGFGFRACKWKKQPDNQCDGYYQFTGQNEIRFGYNAIVEKDRRIINLYVQGMPERRDYATVEQFIQAQNDFWGGNQPYLNGNWTVVEYSDDKLVIEGSALFGRFGEANREVLTKIEMMQ